MSHPPDVSTGPKDPGSGPHTCMAKFYPQKLHTVSVHTAAMQGSSPTLSLDTLPFLSYRQTTDGSSRDVGLTVVFPDAGHRLWWHCCGRRCGGGLSRPSRCFRVELLFIFVQSCRSVPDWTEDLPVLAVTSWWSSLWCRLTWRSCSFPSQPASVSSRVLTLSV